MWADQRAGAGRRGRWSGRARAGGVRACREVAVAGGVAGVGGGVEPVLYAGHGHVWVGGDCGEAGGDAGEGLEVDALPAQVQQPRHVLPTRAERRGAVAAPPADMWYDSLDFTLGCRQRGEGEREREREREGEW